MKGNFQYQSTNFRTGHPIILDAYEQKKADNKNILIIPIITNYCLSPSGITSLNKNDIDKL